MNVESITNIDKDAHSFPPNTDLRLQLQTIDVIGSVGNIDRGC